MAIVTRYFSTAGAGAADGSSWANRAALFSAGNWSSVITGFAFNASDSLLALIGPGTYTCSQAMASGLFVNAPTAANPLLVHGCDSSGNVLAPANPGWVSAQPFDLTGLPVIATTTNIATSSLSNVFWRMLAFEATARTSGTVISTGNMDWCSVINSANGSGVLANIITNSQVVMSGASFSVAVDISSCVGLSNVRVDGSAATTSGTRLGCSTAGAGVQSGEGLTIIGCAGGGYFAATGSATRFSSIRQCTIVNCGTYGFRGSPTASQTVWHQVEDSVIVNCVIGIDGQSAARLLISNCRLRDNSTANLSGTGNYPTDLGVLTASGTDADEFVDSTGKDFRIKSTSTYWGKNLGAGDQPASAGGVMLRPQFNGGFAG